MKRSLFAITFALILIQAAHAQPRIAVEEPVVNVGRVAPNTYINISFKVWSIGSEPLRVAGVQPCCGLRYEGPGKNILPVGDKVEIRAFFNAPREPGTMLRTLTVRTDDPVEPDLMLEVRGEVYPDDNDSRPGAGMPLNEKASRIALLNRDDAEALRAFFGEEPPPLPPRVSLPAIASAAMTGPLIIANPDENFGAMDNRGEIAHVFLIENTSDRPVIVQVASTHVSPGTNETGKRTMPSMAQVEAFSEMLLVARESLTDYNGPWQARYQVSIPGNTNPPVKLTLSGEAIRVFQVEPLAVDFGAIVQDEAVEARIDIYTSRRVRAVNEYFSTHEALRLTPGIDARERSFFLTISTVAPLPPGPFNAEVVLLTSDALQPEVRIPVSAHVIPRLSVRPEKLVVDRTVIGQDEHHVFLAARDRMFGLLSWEVTSPLSIQLSGAGYRFYRFTVSGMGEPKSSTAEKIIFRTNVSGQETMEIPIIR